jgi:hypothetical protein
MLPQDERDALPVQVYVHPSVTSIRSREPRLAVRHRTGAWGALQTLGRGRRQIGATILTQVALGPVVLDERAADDWMNQREPNPRRNHG